MRLTNKNTLRQGFTLAESVIALGILVVLITGFLAVFGPAAQTIRKTISVDEASRLESVLEQELATVRAGTERTLYQDEPFRKAVEWISQSETLGETILIYKYRGTPGSLREDGSYVPATDQALGLSGEDYVIQPAVRRLSDPLLEEDLEAVDGRAFFVKLKALVFEGDALRPSEQPGRLTDPYDPGRDFATQPDSYPQAIIPFEAEYYPLPTVNTTFLEQTFDPANFTRPIFTRKLAVSR